MGAIVPWYTSSDLISAVQRKIAIPLSQQTFSDEDILAFANEEMLISQVPDIMMFHEEYFVFSQDFPLIPYRLRYQIPERALGMKLRDVFYKDTNNNLFEMTRINPDDKAYWERESAVINLMQKYYLENNDLVLAPRNLSAPTGSLRISYFLRPNQLVPNNQAAIAQSFFSSTTINNALINPGDTFTITDTTYQVVYDNEESDTNVVSNVYTAVTGSPSPGQFQIGATSIITATNLMNAINSTGLYVANNGNPSTAVVQVNYLSQNITFSTSNITGGITISSQTGIQFNAPLPSNIVAGINIDFLQTKPGHRTYAISIPLPIGSVSTSSIVFNKGVIPQFFVIGDYICQEYQCIIPQIPPDLHSGLAERVCARILAAQGDMQGLQMTSANVAMIQKAEASLIENRVDGSTQKVNQRKSPLSFLRMGIRRRI